MIESEDVIFRIMDIHRSMPKKKYDSEIFTTLVFLKRISDVFEENARTIFNETNNEEKAWNDPNSHILFVPEPARWQNLLKIKDSLSHNLMIAFEALEQNNDFLKGALTSLEVQVNSIEKSKASKNSIFRIMQDLSLIPMGNQSYNNEKQFPEIYDIIVSKILQGNLEGEITTPPDISKLLVHILDPKDNMSVHDPCCGTGNTLVECVKYVEENGGDISLYGQEINEAAWRYCIYSMIVNNYMTSIVKMGDTIRDPAFVDNEKLLQFDRIVSVPPFGKGKWGYEIADIDKYNRFRYGTPPKNTGDMAYLQHSIACLKDDGRCVMASPQGILFREGPEGEIRKHLIQNDFIETIILLPSKLFPHTAIHTIITVINMNKPAERRNSILFISARNLGEEKKRRLILNDVDINKIVGAYRDYRDIDKFCRVVELEEIRNNDYSLNFSLYVDIFPEIETVDVKQTLNEIQDLHARKDRLMTEIFGIMDTLEETE